VDGCLLDKLIGSAIVHGQCNQLIANSFSTLSQAFDDCTTLSSTFKMLDSFEGMLERDTIAAELAKKQVSRLYYWLCAGCGTTTCSLADCIYLAVTSWMGIKLVVSESAKFMPAYQIN
jgi:hypothetical protein